MTPDEAADLAARTLARIDAMERYAIRPVLRAHYAADRERVASDLAGLRYAQTFRDDEDARRDLTAHFVANLRRTAALYGVEPYLTGDDLAQSGGVA